MPQKNTVHYDEALTALINQVQCNFCNLDESPTNQNDWELITFVAALFNREPFQVETDAVNKAAKVDATIDDEQIEATEDIERRADEKLRKKLDGN